LKQTCKSVLVVDDDRAILHTFSRILRKAGFSTETADSGKEALEKIQTQNYDIALIDMILGDSNGLDLLSKIEKRSPKTMKIMITDADSEEKRNEACKNGADAYLTKPVNPETLLAVFTKKLN
jgi:DNA-binding response OmpR family regulator